MRIVSLLPSATEMCYALGLGEQLRAVTHECDYPRPARAKPHATRNVLPAGITDPAEIDRLVAERMAAGQPIYELDVSLLEAIAPELILTQELCPVCAVSYQDVLAVARQLPGQPQVASLEPTSLGGMLADIERLGELTGRAECAAAVAAALRQRLDWIAGCVAEVAAEPVPVVCLEWLDPPMAGGHWVPEMVELAGGRDLLGRPGQPSRYVSWDEIVAARPEVLVLMPCGYDLERTVAQAELLRQTPRARELPAVRRGQVYAVDGSGYFNRPGPRLVQGVALLAAILHPELFDGLDPGAARCVPLTPLA
ncbi:MAG TPA: cobalamin-binding protein [Thermomicrobiaceae bacterium]|nr:cobalamin-binding protein [Thermomicrobiaceae bacterium]